MSFLWALAGLAGGEVGAQAPAAGLLFTPPAVPFPKESTKNGCPARAGQAAAEVRLEDYDGPVKKTVGNLRHR